MVSTRRSWSWPEGTTGRSSAAPDGHPQTQVMWVDADDEYLLINTEVHRQELQERRARPAGDAHDLGKGRPLSLRRGTRRSRREGEGTEAREHIDKLSQKYHEQPYRTEFQSERMMFRIAPLRQVIRIPS